jgi:hypothetical protein
MSEQGTDAVPGGSAGVWVIGRVYRGTPPIVGCRDYDDVTRQLRGEEVILSHVSRCDSRVLEPD